MPEAFGTSVNLWTLIALNIFVGTIASLVPLPGGGTAVGSVGLSGGLTAVGVPAEIAVAAVLANQLVTNFLPECRAGWRRRICSNTTTCRPIDQGAAP